jgi:hypothetical protein
MTPTDFGATFTGSRLWSATVISTAANELANSVAITCNPHFASPYAVMPLGPPEMPLLMQKTESTPSPGVWATNGYEVVVQWIGSAGLYTAAVELAAVNGPAPALAFVRIGKDGMS